MILFIWGDKRTIRLLGGISWERPTVRYHDINEEVESLHFRCQADQESKKSTLTPDKLIRTIGFSSALSLRKSV